MKISLLQSGTKATTITLILKISSVQKPFSYGMKRKEASEEEIAGMIEGTSDLDQLDIFQASRTGATDTPVHATVAEA